MEEGHNRETKLIARIEKRTKICTNKLKPILTFCSLYWFLTTKRSSIIRGAEIKVLLTIRRLTRMDRLRNEGIKFNLAM